MHKRDKGICVAVLFAVVEISAGACEPNHCPAEVAAGDASTTLQEFSKQTGLQVYYGDVVRGHHTNATHGQRSPTLALKEMLKGSELEFAFVRREAILVTVIPPEIRRSPGLEQVVVTGLGSNEGPLQHRGFQLDAVNLARTGLNDFPDILTALPQISGGVCDNDFDGSRTALTNSTLGCGVNFRGLGPGDAAVLINGRPIAASGTGAVFVDISHIPESSVERVELAPNDFSVSYGADGVGGTANFIMRREFDGAQTEVRVSPGWGSATSEYLLSQTLGTIWDGGSVQISIEDYRRSALLAAARSQGTSNLTPFGGTNYDSLLGSPGTVYSGTDTWAIPVLPTGSSPNAAEFIKGTYNLHDIRQGTDLLPMQSHRSAYLSGTLHLDNDTQLDLDALVTSRRVSDAGPAVGMPITLYFGNPYYFNPAGTQAPVNIYYGFYNALGPTVLDNVVLDGDFTLGFTRTFYGVWRLCAYIGYSWEGQDETVWNLVNPYNVEKALGSGASSSTALDPFVSGTTTSATLQTITSHSQFRSDSGLRKGGVETTGDMDSPVGGMVTLSAGIQYRGDSLATFEQAGDYSASTSAYSQRTVLATFAELCAPIIAEVTDTCVSQRKSGNSGLQVSAAERYEHYSDVGGKAVPALRVYWAAMAGFGLEAGFRRALKVPSLADLNESHNSSEILPLQNTLAPSGYSNVLVWSGANADLRPESGQTWTLSATFGPTSGWTFNVLYYNVLDHNRIEQPTLNADALTSESGEQIVTVAPSAQQRAAVCARSQFSGTLADCLNSPVYALVDARLNNLSRVNTNGVDLTGQREFENRYGQWSIGATGTYILSYRVMQPSGFTDTLDSPGNPLQFRVRAFASWSRRNLSVDFIGHYTDGFTDYVDQPNRHVRSLSTLDGRITWHVAARGKAESCRTSVSVNAQNLFGVSPPFMNNSIGLGYDPTNFSDRGRVISLEVEKCW